MKAWFVWVDDEWGDFVHGETASKAKSMFWRNWSAEAEEWINLHPIRIPELDDIPITPQTLLDHGIDTDWKYCICDCEVCKADTVL